LEKLRLRLATAEALPLLSLLGVLTGFLAGGVILAFRWTIETLQAHYLPGGPEQFETLDWSYRLWVPIAGGLLIGLLFQWAGRAQVGVVHVMERLSYHQGHLPLRNMVLQFVGAAGSIIAGHSVGREGPSVHLGAANGSLLGQWLRLPNNSIRTLVACGVAAAIGASFNTPLAGVVFAMEVVLMEYTLAGFAPVILAAVSATAMSRWVYGSAPAFSVPPLDLGSILELPFVLATGIAIGVLCAAFIHLLQLFSTRLTGWPLWLRTTLAGVVVALCALPVPQVMGVGYDTVNSAVLGELGLGLMLAIVLFKLLATTAAMGFGLPGGLIGPTLVIGAAAGGAMALLGAEILPGEVSSHAFYATIGMGAMMGGTLQAPLAALMAMLELTANPNILLPGMLAVIGATLTSSQLFGKGPLFVELMRTRGLDYRNDPVAQSLRRLGVTAIMEQEFVTIGRHPDRKGVESALRSAPRWLLVYGEERPVTLLPAADLARHLEKCDEAAEIDLLEIPAQRLDVAPIPMQASLQDALDWISEQQVQALYVHGAGRSVVYGIVTEEAIEASYRYQPGRCTLR